MAARTTAPRRCAALLRGVTPANCSMAALRGALEAAGFAGVRTVLSSGNVLLDAPAQAEGPLTARVEAAIERGLGRRFPVVLRPVDELRALLDEDPWEALGADPAAKRVVTFLARPPASRAPPTSRDGVTVHRVGSREVLTSYLRSPKGPVFMEVLEEAFGTGITTRTWDTVARLAR